MPAAYPLTKEQQRQILNLYRELANISEVARQVNVPRKAVERVLRINKVQIRYTKIHRGKFPLEVEKEIIKKYQSGKHAAQLAREYGCAVVTIGYIRRRHNVPQGLHGHRIRFTEDQLHSMKTFYTFDKMSCAAIGKVFGVAPETIRINLIEMDVIVTPRKRCGPDSPSWKNGRPKPSYQGYQQIYLDAADPLAVMRNRMGYILEHRLIMARHLNRPLSSTETVHHVNGDRTDNRIENLQLRSGRHGKGTVLHCADCKSRNIAAIPL